MPRIILIAASLVIILCGAAATREVIIKQQDRKFSVATLDAHVGDILVFVNDDPYVHNIFSLSDTQSFDLGSFGKGDARKLRLEKAGTVEIECAVHPEMRLTVEVAR
jgi:plastocyanin